MNALHTLRRAFESWMLTTAKVIVGSSDPYPAGLERDYWRAFGAGAEAEREACAAHCERIGFADVAFDLRSVMHWQAATTSLAADDERASTEARLLHRLIDNLPRGVYGRLVLRDPEMHHWWQNTSAPPA